MVITFYKGFGCNVYNFNLETRRMDGEASIFNESYAIPSGIMRLVIAYHRFLLIFKKVIACYMFSIIF